MRRIPLSLMLAPCLVATTASAQQPAARDRQLPGRVVEVTAREFNFEAPDSLPAGLTTFRLRQAGRVAAGEALSGHARDSLAMAEGDPTHGFHMLWIVRLDSGRTAEDLHRAEAANTPTPWARSVGGPGFSFPPRTTNATVVLEPGRYALVCYVGSAHEDRRRHHLLRGMIRPLTVVPARGRSARLPRPDLVIRVLARDSLHFSRRPPRAGTWTIEVVNESGSRWQEFGIRRVLAGHSAAEAFAWRRRDGTPPPVEPWAGLSSVPLGKSVVTTVDMPVGTYLFGSGRTPVTVSR